MMLMTMSLRKLIMYKMLSIGTYCTYKKFYVRLIIPISTLYSRFCSHTPLWLIKYIPKYIISNGNLSRYQYISIGIQNIFFNTERSSQIKPNPSVIIHKSSQPRYKELFNFPYSTQYS